MIWPQRRIGPKPPNIIARMWSAMVVSAAPIRLWAQILGYGTNLGVTVYALHNIFQVLERGGQPIQIVTILAEGIIYIALAQIFVQVIQTVAITELKLGFNASKSGLRADLEHDDDKPTTAHVEGVVTVTTEGRA